MRGMLYIINSLQSPNQHHKAKCGYHTYYKKCTPANVFFNEQQSLSQVCRY